MKEDNIDYGALLYAEEDKYIRNEIHNGTPETRKKWGIEDWKYGISLSADLISEKDCPTDDFSAEDWKEIILESSPIVVQYCNCTKDVLAILTKEDFQDYDSWQICETIALEGDWLAHLMPLERIEQEDFDNYLVCCPEDYSSEDEFLELVGARFPDNKIPDHLDYPHKGENRK